MPFDLLPRVVLRLREAGQHDLSEFVRLAIAAGCSGLDLKGASSAASTVRDVGIPLADYVGRPLTDEDAERYLEQLISRALHPTPLFEFEAFVEDFGHSALVLWFTDDVIESFFDLLVVQELLRHARHTSVCVVPKRAEYGNDLSLQQLLQILHLPPYRELRGLSATGRFFWTASGPSLAALNWTKLSPEVRGLVRLADLALIKGCRAFELVHGILDIPLYNAFVVARTMSERISGLSARESPPVLFKLGPRECAYWGLFRETPEVDGREHTTSTIMDTIRRRNMTSGYDMTAELANLLQGITECHPADRHAAQSAAVALAERLIDLTVSTYDCGANRYAEIRWTEPHDLDKRLWREMLSHCASALGLERPRILDVATGNGRDLDYAQNVLKIDAVGIEKCPAFVRMIEDKIQVGILTDGSVVECDMRDLSHFEGESFDVVRQNASLLHLPVIAKGVMADAALAESNRVLRPHGLLFVMTKEGDGLSFLDTEEGLGGRFFQFHTFGSLTGVLERNGFLVRKIAREIEERGSKSIPWLCAIAEKKTDS